MKVTVPPAQTVVLSAETETLGVTVAFTVMVIVLLVALALLTQAALLVNCNEITSPFAKALVV